MDIQLDEAAAEAEAKLRAELDALDSMVWGAGGFILDEPDVTAVWGEGQEVLWAAGEVLLVAGPAGAGKSTLAQQLCLSMIGVNEPELLGLPVAVLGGHKKVLYVAADRPRQVARSMRRMVGESDRGVLNHRMVFWPGRLLKTVTQEPTVLAYLAQALGAGVVVVDSLKDVVSNLNDDDAGVAIGAAFQAVTDLGIELIALHHYRKSPSGGGGERSIDDSYGSALITAKAGSVIFLEGTAGAEVIQLHHQKQPADVVGPMSVLRDRESGGMSVEERVDLVAVCQALGTLTARQAADALGLENPSPADLKRVKRQLGKLVTSGRLVVLQRKGFEAVWSVPA